MTNNQEGSVLVVALIMLVLLTILGIAATNTSTLETRIAGNERVYKQNLYAAEAAAMECAQRIDNGEDEMTIMGDRDDNWLLDNDSGQDKDNSLGTPLSIEDGDFDERILDEAVWNAVAGDSANVPGEAQFLAYFMGVTHGASLDMSQTNVYDYRTFGRRDLHGGGVVVELGLRQSS